MAVPNQATGQEPDPAQAVVNDCTDDGVIQGTHSREAIDTALQRIYGNTVDEPYDGCTPELWRLLDLSLAELGGPIRDCMTNERVEGAYSPDLLEQATDELPRVTHEFSDCASILPRAADEARESVGASSTSIAHSTAKRYAERQGRKTAKRSTKVSVRLLSRKRASRWYGQVRWPAPKRGVCYAEVIVKRSGSRVVSGTTGRWCSTAAP